MVGWILSDSQESTLFSGQAILIFPRPRAKIMMKIFILFYTLLLGLISGLFSRIVILYMFNNIYSSLPVLTKYYKFVVYDDY